MLQAMRTNVDHVARECEALHGLRGTGTEALSSIAFALKMNNLKVSSSQLVVQIVHQALHDLRDHRLQERLEVRGRAPPARRPLRRAHGRQRPHLRDERDRCCSS